MLCFYVVYLSVTKYVLVRVTLRAFVVHWYTYAEPRSIGRLLFPSQCSSERLLLTLCLMVWDWWVLRAGPILFYWPKLLYPYYNLLLFFPFSSSFL